ncbi:unnamed protein product [Rotaria socialis]
MFYLTTENRTTTSLFSSIGVHILPIPVSLQYIHLVIFLTLFLSISKYQCEYASCRTNCSTNGTFDDECWRQALTYQSAELVERLFSFSSLSVHVDTFQRKHSSQLNDSIKFIDTALNNHLLNESKDAKLNMNLFTETKQILINFCRNLTSQPVTDVRQIPSLYCYMQCDTNHLHCTIY